MCIEPDGGNDGGDDGDVGDDDGNGTRSISNSRYRAGGWEAEVEIY